MADIAAGHWVLISTGDVDNLRKFFRGCREQCTSTSGWIIAPPHKRKQIEDAQLDLPRGWSVYKAGPLYTKRDQWFGLLWDEQCPQQPGWDTQLIHQATGWNVVTSAECLSFGDWRCGAVVWSVPALEAGGGLDLSALGESLAQWGANAAESKAWRVEKAIQLPRRSPPGGLVVPAEADAVVVEKLKALQAQHGVRMAAPKWDGVSIMLSTPSGASRPEALYSISIFSTMRDLDRLGVRYEWGLERYNADIGLARSHIISEFLRSSCTHLLMIDDDMTWEVEAVHRLIHADKPLVAVAGPKKRYPLIFAASHADEKGNPIPMTIDDDTGTAEVTSVGAAFMLIRRDCAEAMRDAYPELEYIGFDGKTSYGLFVQAIENKAYLPEDFSFCQRWRKIGGKVYICPDVPLGHIGAHEFKGDLLSNARKRAQ